MKVNFLKKIAHIVIGKLLFKLDNVLQAFFNIINSLVLF